MFVIIVGLFFIILFCIRFGRSKCAPAVDRNDTWAWWSLKVLVGLLIPLMNYFSVSTSKYCSAKLRFYTKLNTCRLFHAKSSLVQAFSWNFADRSAHVLELFPWRVQWDVQYCCVQINVYRQKCINTGSYIKSLINWLNRILSNNYLFSMIKRTDKVKIIPKYYMHSFRNKSYMRSNFNCVFLEIIKNVLRHFCKWGDDFIIIQVL